MGDATLFERIVEGHLPSHPVARGQGWYAFLDVFPRRPGHTLVVPERGVPRLADLGPEERRLLMDGVAEAQRRLSVVFERSGSSELYGFNLLSQDHGRGSPYPTQGHGSGGG